MPISLLQQYGSGSCANVRYWLYTIFTTPHICRRVLTRGIDVQHAASRQGEVSISLL